MLQSLFIKLNATVSITFICSIPKSRSKKRRLKPAKLAGMLSEGMILCAEDDEGNLALMVPEKDIKPGSEVC